jgi:transcriptional regulator with XRE-family HTH domain
VGLPASGRRRVTGLRREEVATLAGISADYYLRLEQGRERHPSHEVLDALARALLLNRQETSYLHQLAQIWPRNERATVPTTVPDTLRQLIDGLDRNPAYVQNRFSDVLAVNALAAALSPNYRPGNNLLKSLFLDASERELRRDWEQTTEEGVANLRSLVGPDVDDPRLIELVGELSVRSERFRRLWGRHDVRPHVGRVSRLHHPHVGDLELQSNKMTVIGAESLIVVVFHTAPGSPSAELLGTLGSLVPLAGEGVTDHCK